MILESLVNYYDILTAAGEISRLGYSMVKVSYALNLFKDGTLLNIIPLKILSDSGKKMVEISQSMELPEQEKRTVGIKSNFLCENSSYILGADNKGKPERTKQCFEAFKALHHDVLEPVHCTEAQAILSFLDEWSPESIASCEPIKEYLTELLSGVNIIFHIAGYGYPHENPDIKKAWERYKAGQSNANQMQCLVTGEVRPVARLHPSIKGVKDAQSMGASIVSFNERAYESYGREKQQGLNAPVSEYAAFAYTTVLNLLLNDRAHKQNFGDATIVYWAKSSNPLYRSLFKFVLEPQEITENDMKADRYTEGILESIFKKLVEGKPIGDIDGLNMNTLFYILGLAPNAARLSVRFYAENTFGNILLNMKRHYDDLEIVRSPKEYEFLPLWKLLLETVPPMSKDKASSPLLSGAVLRSIFLGRPYPEALYNNVMVRIRAERDITRGKAAIVKACLLRKLNNEKDKEVLTVSLNEQSENKAYILGRLFSILEKAQLDANPGINTTIKDRYFTSACATPGSVFPILLRLSHHHISKSDFGHISNRRIRDLMDKLNVLDNPFPHHLTLEEQGVFILGYYHQSKANYAKKDKEELNYVRRDSEQV